MKVKEKIALHLRQLAPHVKERDTGQLLIAALAEIDRLEAVAATAHDRLLRGDSDLELLALLKTAWDVPNDRVEGRDAVPSRRVPSHDGLEG